MAWYDLESENKKNKIDAVKLIKTKELILKKVSILNDLIDVDLKEGFQYRIITDKNFNALVFIDFILQKIEAKELTFAIYRMNVSAVNRIIELSKTVKINVVVSSFFRENKKYERWARELVFESESNPNLSVSFAWNHAKITLFKSVNGEKYVFEGSGNLSDNARIEQYLIELNEKSYDFHYEWITNCLKNGIK